MIGGLKLEVGCEWFFSFFFVKEHQSDPEKNDGVFWLALLVYCHFFQWPMVQNGYQWRCMNG